jgi:hypothetical protein
MESLKTLALPLASSVAEFEHRMSRHGMGVAGGIQRDPPESAPCAHLPASWHHHYNRRCTRAGMGGVVPIGRLPAPGNDDLTLYSHLSSLTAAICLKNRHSRRLQDHTCIVGLVGMKIPSLDGNGAEHRTLWAVVSHGGRFTVKHPFSIRWLRRSAAAWSASTRLCSLALYRKAVPCIRRSWTHATSQ